MQPGVIVIGGAITQAEKPVEMVAAMKEMLGNGAA
jgi:3-keto-L-gulonate-6-phosphate decarboxylase